MIKEEEREEREEKRREEKRVMIEVNRKFGL